MIESITGGRETPNAAVREAFEEIDLILKENRRGY
jgi:8-oxo-dGTP pyrophosphatase MutT (NUDIX family)